MKQFVHRGWRHANAGAWITTGYVLVALVAGAESPVGTLLLGHGISPISSASAVAILSAIASGMMALTAIVFSLVFVAVQLGNTSYSPRLLAVIGEDRFLAHSLGIFAGTFLYALMAIRSVDVVGGPGINVSVIAIAFVWLLASIVVLVCLLPRIRGLSIGEVLIGLQRSACSVAARVYPVELDAAGRSPAPPPASPAAAIPVTHVISYEGAPKYLVGLDIEGLVQCASEADAEVMLPIAIGDAVMGGDRLAIVYGGARPVNERKVREAIWLAGERAIHNDPAYAIRLLVDIAIRALSPAVNDPTTAVNVLVELDGLLRLIGRRRLEDNHSRDAQGVVRLVRVVPSWEDLVALALTEIHQYGREAYQVQRRLSTMLRDLPEVLPPERRPVLERFARWRVHSLQSVLDAAQGWIDPSAIDRQGIGHLEAIDPWTPAARLE